MHRILASGSDTECGDDGIAVKVRREDVMLIDDQGTRESSLLGILICPKKFELGRRNKTHLGANTITMIVFSNIRLMLEGFGVCGEICMPSLSGNFAGGHVKVASNDRVETIRVGFSLRLGFVQQLSSNLGQHREYLLGVDETPCWRF